MPRRARLDAPGTLHHVIVRGIEKRRIVNDVSDRKNFIKRLGALSVTTHTRTYAWALMTNHAYIYYVALILVFPISADCEGSASKNQ